MCKPRRSLWRNNLQTPWSWTFHVHNREEINFCCLKLSAAVVQSLSGVHVCVTPGTAACQTPLSNILQVRILGRAASSLLTQGSSPRLLHWQVGSWPLNSQGSLSRLLSENCYRSPYTLKVRGKYRFGRMRVFEKSHSGEVSKSWMNGFLKRRWSS